MIAAPIRTTINLATFAIELAVNPVALAIKAVRPMIITGRIGAVRLSIQAIINAITLLVETLLDAITTIVYAIRGSIGRSIIRAVGLIGKYSPADDYQNA